MGYRGLDIWFFAPVKPDALMRALSGLVFLYDQEPIRWLYEEKPGEWNDQGWGFLCCQLSDDVIRPVSIENPSLEVLTLGGILDTLSGPAAEVFAQRTHLIFDFGFDVGEVPNKIQKIMLNEEANQVIARFGGVTCLTMYPHDE